MSMNASIARLAGLAWIGSACFWACGTDGGRPQRPPITTTDAAINPDTPSDAPARDQSAAVGIRGDEGGSAGSVDSGTLDARAVDSGAMGGPTVDMGAVADRPSGLITDAGRGQAQALIIAGAKQNVGYLVGLDGSQSKGMNPFGQVDVYGVKHYAWNFGDGTADQASEYLTTVTHVFAAAGTYKVGLTVTDHAGDRASASSVIEVGTLPRQTATGGNIAAAITALGGQPGIVAVPEGTFTLGSIAVPAGVIIQGAGAGRTKLVGVTFATRGDNIRITGIEADGAGKGDDNLFSHYRNKNLLVDHSDWHHYVQATGISDFASATLEDNFIHDHDYAGLGYGIQVTSGSWAMVRRNRFQRNRHSVAAGGKSGTTASEYVLMPTGYDLIDNSISVDAVNRDVTIDNHPTGHGRIRIAGNRFENVAYGIGLFDGWGEIRGNTFTGVSGYVILSRRPVHNGNFIAAAGVYRLDIAGNTFVQCRNHYQIEYGTNISIEGKPVTPPYTADVPPP